MSTKKVIQIKPELFKMSSSKNKTIRNKSGMPIINATKLKEQLSANILKRKKAKENIKKQELEIKSEFEKSFNFMLHETEKTVSKGGSSNILSTNSSSSLHNKSIRSRPIHHIPKPIVSLETPSKDLHEVELNPEPDSSLSYKLDNSIRYGCLKNGLKKTYKNISSSSSSPANKVQFINLSDSSMNSISHIPEIMDAPIMGIPRPPQITEISVPIQPTVVDISTSYIPEINTTTINTPVVETLSSITNNNDLRIKSVSFPENTSNIISNVSTSTSYGGNGIEQEEFQLDPVIIESNPIKPITQEEIIKVPSIKEIHKKKTTIRHYKLGKHKTIKNRVSVLCNNKDRIDKLKQAQRELQRTSMEEMKKYLMSRNLLRSGSRAPADVIKKLYESAYLAADITNTDDDVLLDNYMDK